MSNYQVTARKWRPQDFGQVIGQEHVTTALTNAVQSGKIPHAYLFSGPRGVGKTSTARILAKILNCVESPNVCGKCNACIEISTGQSLDVREIDGASNRGIEQIREIRDNAVYTPIALKYKIFIIDEVHMLTKEASNALLKVLEEPPAHVIFMLATTEPNKVLATIRSRCQHYLLKRISLDTIVTRLQEIATAEGYQYEISALEEIARAGDGSMRDSQTIFDQAALYSQANLTLNSVREVLGIPEDSYFENIIQNITNQDAIAMLSILHGYLSEAGDGSSFAENLTKFLRQGLLVKELPDQHPLLDMSTDQYERTKILFEPYTKQDIIILMNLSLELCDILRKEISERFWIESTLFKMLDYKNRVSLSEIRQEILKLTASRTNITPTQTTAVRPNSKSSVVNNNTNLGTTESVITGTNGFADRFNERTKKNKENSLEENTNTISLEPTIKPPVSAEKKQIEKINDVIEDKDLEKTLRNMFEIQ